LLRELTARQLRGLSEETWQQSIQHPQKGELTLEHWLEIYDEHLKVHLAQIQRTLDAWRIGAAV
jgi:hypothetical protein